MTMTRTIRKRLRRYALVCLMAATTAGLVDSAQSSYAQDTHDSQSLCGWVEEFSKTQALIPPPISADPVRKTSEPIAFFAVDYSDTLTIDTCNYGDWLLGAIAPETEASAQSLPASPAKRMVAATVAEPTEPATSEDVADAAPAEFLGHVEPSSVGAVASRTSSQFNQTMAAIAAAASAGNPLPFGHWTEPFAMVGPAGSHSVFEIETFQEWFAKGRRAVESVTAKEETAAEIATEIAAEIAAETEAAAPEVVASVDTNDDGYIPIVDFDGNISGFELVETTKPAIEEPAIEEIAQTVVPTSPTFIGSSPIIATIKEAYAPYDLADSDKAADETDAAITTPIEIAPAVGETETATLVWTDGLFSPSGQPFCVRSLAVMREPGWSPLAKNVEGLIEGSQNHSDPIDAVATDAVATDAVATDAVAENAPASNAPQVDTQTVDAGEENVAEATVATYDEAIGSAECVLDEWVWYVGSALEEESVTDEWLRPDRIGKRVAQLVVSSDDMVSQMARRLALVWPPAPLRAKPIQTAGAELLARAEVAEQPESEGSVEPDDSAKLAQANAMLLQWVTVAQSVIEDVSNRFSDVTEVARNRGTQDTATRR